MFVLITFLIFLTFCGHGLLINNFLLKNKLNNINFNFKYLYISLSGFFSLACLTTILNFFFSLNIYLNSTLAIIALISLVYLCKSDIKKILIYNFVATIITSILILGLVTLQFYKI